MSSFWPDDCWNPWNQYSRNDMQGRLRLDWIACIPGLLASIWNFLRQLGIFISHKSPVPFSFNNHLFTVPHLFFWREYVCPCNFSVSYGIVSHCRFFCRSTIRFTGTSLYVSWAVRQSRSRLGRLHRTGLSAESFWRLMGPIFQATVSLRAC